MRIKQLIAPNGIDANFCLNTACWIFGALNAVPVGEYYNKAYPSVAPALGICVGILDAFVIGSAANLVARTATGTLNDVPWIIKKVKETVLAMNPLGFLQGNHNQRQDNVVVPAEEQAQHPRFD